PPAALPASRSATPNAAVAMYVEQVPTASGPVASGSTSSKATGLRSSVLKELRAAGGRYEAALIKLANTSPLRTKSAAPSKSSRTITGDDARLVGLIAAL